MIVLDVQPLFGGDADYRAKYTRSIAQIWQAHQPHLLLASDFPLSALLWAPPKETEVVETRVFAAFKYYLAADVEKVDRAAPVTGSAKLDSILQAQLRYLPYRSEKKPGRGMLKRFCGEESTKGVYSQLFVRLGTEAGTIGK